MASSDATAVKGQATPMQPTAVDMSGKVMGGVLAGKQDFFVAQTPKGCFQECLGCDANNQFEFKVGHNKEAATVAVLEEETNCCIRFLCKGNRPWTTRLYSGNTLDKHDGDTVWGTYIRPCRCAMGNCKCCCYQEVETWLGDAEKGGKQIGGVRELMWFCVPTFGIYDKDPAGPYEYYLHQPTCCGGMMVNPCAQGCCNCRIPFFFYKDPSVEEPLKATGAVNTAPGAEGVADAQITKVWVGLKKECLTTADSFEFKSPDDASDEAKMRLLGATIMIDQLFFEGDDQNNDN